MSEQYTLPASDAFSLSDFIRIGDMIPGGFFVYCADEPQNMLYVNKNMLRIFGCASLAEYQELTGYTFRGLVHPDDFERIQKSIDEQIADSGDEKLDYVEYRIIRRDGAVRWVDDYGHFAQLAGYGDVYYVFISDITEKREAQEQLIRAEIELEREKRAGEIKSQFLFHVSHDIRTPMNAIMGYSELIRHHADEPARVSDCARKIRDSGSQLLAMIDDILDLSKLQFGRVEVTVKPCDLREQLHDTVEQISFSTGRKSISVTEEYRLPDDTVMLDAEKFKRIIGGLLSNAVKFTPEGGRICLSARRTEVSDSRYGRYAFSVSDTGVGISEAFQKTLFDAFEQEVSSTESGTSGIGLGLSIIKRLVDMMGGSITFESEKDKGTVFTVFLPLKLSAGKGEAEPAAPQESYRAEGEHRILLVEDIEINRMLAETILEEAGFLVESVPDGCDAVDAIREHSLWYYDLVLMDIQMPVMNGYEATRAIRALNRADAKTLPIVALSANAMDEDRRMSMESGMNNHVAKPFDIAQLVSTINYHIANTEKDTGIQEE